MVAKSRSFVKSYGREQNPIPSVTRELALLRGDMKGWGFKCKLSNNAYSGIIPLVGAQQAYLYCSPWQKAMLRLAIVDYTLIIDIFDPCLLFDTQIRHVIPSVISHISMLNLY